MQTRERAHCARSVFPFIKKKSLNYPALPCEYHISRPPPHVDSVWSLLACIYLQYHYPIQHQELIIIIAGKAPNLF